MIGEPDLQSVIRIAPSSGNDYGGQAAGLIGRRPHDVVARDESQVSQNVSILFVSVTKSLGTGKGSRPISATLTNAKFG